MIRLRALTWHIVVTALFLLALACGLLAIASEPTPCEQEVAYLCGVLCPTDDTHEPRVEDGRCYCAAYHTVAGTDWAERELTRPSR